MSTPPPWTSFHVAISIHECHLTPSLWIGPSYLVTHLDARINLNRFHQLAKTKLGLSRMRPKRWRRKMLKKNAEGKK
jgi:hypothetical protein